MARRKIALIGAGQIGGTLALTGFPFLDDTGQNAYGGAIGVQYLFDLQQQLVFEVAAERRLSDFSNSFDDVVEMTTYHIGLQNHDRDSSVWFRNIRIKELGADT